MNWGFDYDYNIPVRSLFLESFPSRLWIRGPLAGFLSGKPLERKLFPGVQPWMGSCTSTRHSLQSSRESGIGSDWALHGREPVVESEGGQENF